MSVETTCPSCHADFERPPTSGACPHPDVCPAGMDAWRRSMMYGVMDDAIRSVDDEPQAQRTEEHEGGVPDVQGPQEAGDETGGQAAPQREQADTQRRRAVRGPTREPDPPRHLDVRVTHCSRCPFHHVLKEEVHMPPQQSGEDGYDVPAGHYCNHPNSKGTDAVLLATEEMIRDTNKAYSFRTWLDVHERADFPHTCPLEEPDTHLVPSGHRAVDLG